MSTTQQTALDVIAAELAERAGMDHAVWTFQVEALTLDDYLSPQAAGGTLIELGRTPVLTDATMVDRWVSATFGEPDLTLHDGGTGESRRYGFDHYPVNGRPFRRVCVDVNCTGMAPHPARFDLVR